MLDARLDDLMVRYASYQGGDGPHCDSYDVFLLQPNGRRRWRIGRQRDLSLQPDMPLKILANFVPEQEFDLEPGDMLYLPPRYAHDGVAMGECMTYSIGFRSPRANELAGELLQRLAQEADDSPGDLIYRDPAQLAVSQPARVPDALAAFASKGLNNVLKDARLFAKCLGEHLTEPKPNVWFEAPEGGNWPGALKDMACQLDQRSRMMYDAHFVYVNGESYVVRGQDAPRIRLLANQRMLSSRDIKKLSPAARQQLAQWLDAGWITLIQG